MERDARRWLVVLGLATFLLPGTLAQQSRAAGLSARWHGQDRHDVVGEVARIGPSGVQDLHFTLGGLPPRLEIARLVVTGHGGDQWEYPTVNEQHRYAAIVDRKPRATTAEVFVEPARVETGRDFCLKVTFKNGPVAEVFVKGGKADPNLRMPSASLVASWVGQERFDLVGMGPSVGPDGLVDARLALRRLAKTDKVRSILLEDGTVARWEFGPNKSGHNDADLYLNPKDATEGSLFFQPDRDLAGRTLRVSVTYESGQGDSATVTAGKTAPALAMPKASLPKLTPLNFSARWLGQDGSAVTGPGDVHVELSGNSTRPIAAAVLSDGVRGNWLYRANERVKHESDHDPRPLVLRRSARGGIDLYFPPYRDETKTRMTLRLVFQDGESGYASFEGGACDPARTAPSASGPARVARPGDDLNALAVQGGTLSLSRGVYRLATPLALPRPIVLEGEEGAELRFSQPPGAPPWTTAIKIRASGTTLRGFAARFEGPIRWRSDVSWGPAVIGTTDNLDNMPQPSLASVVIERLDVKGPASSKSDGWEESVKLMRLLNVSSGRIVGNTLRGGCIEFFGGPWMVEGNHFLGTPAHTFNPAVFALHDPHDVVVRKNRAESEPGSGKTWRFLLFTNRGHHDRVEDNVVSGIGPRDDDVIPSMNQPEIMLTESYHIRFEGRIAGISSDGRVLKVHRIPAEPPKVGDVVSVLAGPSAGQWRRVVHRIEPTAYLLDEPLPQGVEIVSITPGFVREVFSGNTIDARGGDKAAGFVLAGNHFGSVVARNRVVGAGDAFQILAFPSERPGIWGWSHVPYLDGAFEGNVLEDSSRGAQLGVLHNPSSKSNRGRLYFTMKLRGNTVK